MDWEEKLWGKCVDFHGHACGVDAIQVVLACSVGKGNLLFRLRDREPVCMDCAGEYRRLDL